MERMVGMSYLDSIRTIPPRRIWADMDARAPPRQDWHRFEPKAAGTPRWPG